MEIAKSVFLQTEHHTNAQPTHTTHRSRHTHYIAYKFKIKLGIAKLWAISNTLKIKIRLPDQPRICP